MCWCGSCMWNTSWNAYHFNFNTTMSIISQETWDKMPEEEKEKIISQMCNIKDEDEYAKYCYIELFGKENLQPKPKTPKIWADVKESENLLSINYDRRHTHLTLDNNIVNTKVVDKIIATYKIAYLINKCYGGIVTEEDGWEIIPIQNALVIQHSFTVDRPFVFFHTKQQAEEFISYPENVELVKHYHCM